MQRFQQYLLPGIVFQSVLIGGAYATGREIVQYGARFGAMGLWSILAIFAGFTLVAMVAYEFARLMRAYDYRSFVRHLIGPLWPVFDVLYVVMVVLTIAVVNAATGSVVERVLGWPYWVGVALVVVLVGLLLAGGRRVIERFKTIGSVLLYGGYLVFAGLVLAKTWGHVEQVFAAGDTRYAGTVTIGEVFFTGVLYVGYNLGVLPAALFVLDKQTERRHTLGAGLITGVMATVPFVLTYLALMGFYPSTDVFDAPVPWLVMLRTVGGPVLITAFALIILWTLIETSTGMIHAVVDRIDAGLQEAGLPRLSPARVGLFSVVVLLAAAALSHFGIIALVARGYGAMAYAFLLLFALPLLTRGLWRVLRK